MSKKIKGIVIDIGGDVTGLNNALKSVNKNINYTQKELRDVEKLLKLDPKNTELLAQKQTLLSKVLEENTDKLKALQKAKDDADKAMKNGTEVNQDMYRKLQREIISTEQKIKSLNNESSKVTQLANNLNKIGNSATNVGKKILPVTAGVTALGVASVKTGIDFETAFAGVRKTVDATEEEYEELKQGILDMSKELPASAVEIAEVAESAGQLGIAKENILEFTRTMIDLGESTNLSSTEAASSLAKFSNITGMSANNYRNLGSVVVALGNNFATTEADIVSMATRLAPAGKLAKLTEQEIMALATSMSSVGIEAEAGGTAMTQTLSAIEKAVVSGGDELKQFASISGMSAEEFKSTWENNAISAIQAFVTGLGKLEEQGESATLILDEMGLSGVRQSNMLKSLALSAENMQKAVDLSNKAWKENTALTKEAEQRYATTASKLAMLVNKLKEIGIQVAETLLPIVNEIVDKLGEWTEKFSELDDKTKKVIITVTAVVGAAGPLLIVVGKLITASSKIITVVKGSTVAMGALKAGMTALSGPIGAIIVGATALGGILYYNYQKNNELSESYKELRSEMDESKEAYDETNKAIEEQSRLAKENASSARELVDEMYNISDSERSVTDKNILLNKKLEELQKLIPDVVVEIDEQTGSIITQREEIEDLIDSYTELAIAQEFSDKLSAEAKRYAQATIAHNEARKEAIRLEEEYIKKKEELEKLDREFLDLSDTLPRHRTREQQDSLEALGDKVMQYNKEVKQMKKELDAYNETTLENIEIMYDAKSNMEEYKSQQEELTKSIKQAGNEQENNNKKVEESNNDLTTTIITNTETQEKLSKDLLQTYEKEVEDKKFYNQMDIADELAYWEEKKRLGKLGAEELKEVDKKIYSSRQELSKEILKLSEESISNQKTYNDLSLEEELHYWNAMRNIESFSAEEIAEIDKKLYAIKQEIAQKEQEQLEKQIEANEEATRKYNEQFESRANSLKNYNGIFNEVAEKEDISGKKLLKNLKNQVKEFENWQEGMAKLSERGMDEGVLEELTNLGPNSLDKVDALLSLSDKQIQEYSAQYQKLGKLASEQALTELGPLEKSISTIKSNLSTLNEDIAYATIPATQLVSETKVNNTQILSEEAESRLFELITQLVVEGGNKVAESVFTAIPDIVKLIINGRDVAEVIWKDVESEANRRGKKWFTREQVAAIARSVMPRTAEE